MGTRSLTAVLNGRNEEIMLLYRQFDGYPTGHGQELKSFLEEFQICNGIGEGQRAGKWANGMGCLAAQIVAHLKIEIGNIYLFKPGTRNVGEEYTYTIEENDNHYLDMTVVKEYQGGKILYSGPIKDFDPEKAEEGED